ncbi:MAG: hypothetical protein WD042_13270 [Phycisphaeraceae bacterium]
MMKDDRVHGSAMMPSRKLWIVVIVAMVTMVIHGVSRADAAPAPAPEATAPTTQPADESAADADRGLTPRGSDQATTAPAAAPPEAPEATNAPSAEDVMRQLLEKRPEPPLTAPRRAPSVTDLGSAPLLARDPAVMGTSPDAKQTSLRREGEFVIHRRGRLIRSPNGAQSVFVFEADSAQSPEAPMILLPSQMTQNIETIAQERGDKIVFTLSGQVFAYRGANYLLPSMAKQEVDKGNLQR